MKHRKTPVFLLVILLVLTAGCVHPPTGPSEPTEYRVVTQIDVLYQKDLIVSEGSFSEPDKMQKILWYLRRISPYGTPAEDPEQVQGSNFYITLLYSDNTKKTYHQRDNRFMRVNGGPWKRIDPKKAILLSQILGTMDSDDADPNATAPFLMPTK